MPRTRKPKIEGTPPKVQVKPPKVEPVMPKVVEPVAPEPTAAPPQVELPRVSIADVLAQKTEPKVFFVAPTQEAQAGESNETNTPVHPTPETPSPDETDFVETGKENEGEQPTPPTPQQAPKPETPPQKQVLSHDEYEAQARTIIATLETLGVVGLPFAYTAKLFTDEEKPFLEELKYSYTYLKDGGALADAMYAKMDEQKAAIMRGLIPKYQVYQKLVDKIPFSEDEQNRLIGPLTEVFKKYNVTMGCEVSLIISVLAVTGSRLAPIFF